jgi:amino acid transporter
MENKKTLGYFSVVSIGIGGMVGGGIFAVLGLAVDFSHGGTPIAFTIAGIVALITAYSYSKLSVRFPSSGGTVHFLNLGLGTGILTGGLNILLWISYIVMLSLYSHAFGSYGATFFPEDTQLFWKHILISSVVISFTAINVLGAKTVGRAEEFIVAVKIIILLSFIVIGFWSIDSQNLQVDTWSPPISLLAGGMIIFLAYEGFELIANTGKDVRNPKKILPKAFYTAVIFVIVLYVLISVVTIGNLSLDQIAESRDYVLAESAKLFLGSYGFVIIVVAALLSTGSAINATLYGACKISYIIAKAGELPVQLEKMIWKKPIEGLLITSVITLLIANLFELSSIALMGSAGFLLIFAAVNWSNFRLYQKTSSHRWISGLGIVACLGAFGVLIWQSMQISQNDIWILVSMLGISFAIEIIYKKISGRKIKSFF